MSNSLIPTELNLVPVAMDDLDALTTSNEYFPRVQLMSATSKLVQEGKMKQGDWALVTGKDEHIDLGNSFDCVIITAHAKALRIAGDEIHAVYDMKHPDFQQIVEMSKEADSGCMFGPEYLLLLANGKYATYHAASATARREAKNINALIGSAATIAGKLIVGKKHRWHGPVCVPCSSFAGTLPDMEEIKAKAELFRNPQTSNKEMAKSGGGRER